MTSPPVDDRLLSSLLCGRLPGPALESLAPADWGALARLAFEQGAAPLLYWQLSRSGLDGLLPDELYRRLRAAYVGTRLNNGQILGELEGLARLFERAGIPVVVLKGACYALTIYPDLGLRPMADLDLLVPVFGIQPALRIAGSAGYVTAVPEASPGLDDELAHAACLVKTHAPFTTLELHHTLVAEASFRHAVPVDWFWEQTEPLPVAGLQMLTPTAQTLYACAHAMLQHGGRNTSLRWLVDLDRLVRAHTGHIDWDLLVAQARRLEWGSAAGAALARVVDLCETPVPHVVLDELSQGTDRNAERVAALQEPPATHTLEELQKLKALRWPGRLRLLLALAAPTPAHMRWRYGLTAEQSLPGWYLHRWWGILKDLGKTAVLRLRRSRPAHPGEARKGP